VTHSNHEPGRAKRNEEHLQQDSSVQDGHRSICVHLRFHSFPLLTMRSMSWAMCAAAASLFLGLHASATLAQTSSAEQLAGLFIQGCMPFAGDATPLREWARQHGLPEVPDPARKAFLHGAPGTVFDASAQGVKLVLVSSDDGICSTVTNSATRAGVTQALEADLRRADVAFRLVIERDDKHAEGVHYREYLASKPPGAWRILAATVNDPQGGQAMLTAAPE
jgi:hypothetical protein